MSWLTDTSASGHTLSVVGAATNSTAQAKWGIGSLALPTLGGSAALSSAHSSDWEFGSSSWTVEGWFYPTATPTSGHYAGLVTMFGDPGTGGDGTGWGLFYTSTGLEVAFFKTGNVNEQAATFGASLTANTWQHIAAVYDTVAGNITCFVNGTKVGTPFSVSGITFQPSTLSLNIGNSSAGTQEFKGFIDEVRITNGVARYPNATNFSPPTGPFPVGSGSDTNWSNVVLLASFEPGNGLTGVGATGAPGSVGLSTSSVVALTGNTATASPGSIPFKDISGGAEGVPLSSVSGTGVVTFFNPIITYAMNLNLPTPLYAAVGWESDKTKNLLGVVALTLPLPQLAVLSSGGVSTNVDITLPVPTLQITGSTPVVGTVVLALPSLKFAANGKAGVSGSAALTLPTPSLSITTPSAAQLTLPVPTLTSTAVAGLVGTVTLTMPLPALAASGNVPFSASPALTLPVPTISAQGFSGQLARVANTLPSFTIAAQGSTGVLGSVALTLPLFDLDVEGYQPAIGAVQLVLPMMQLVAVGSTKNPGTPAAIVMHTETFALSSYSNYPFNSFAQFNGVFLGASDTGIFALTGPNDNGVPIQAAARVGITDFATSHLKRVDRVYVGYRADGDLVLRIFTDEVTQRDYRLTATGRVGLHGNHARLGKGLTARYWQFELRNQNGADFDVNIIELKPTELKRRIGGFDA